MDLQIAGLPVTIESAHGEWFAGRFADYVRQDARPPVFTLSTRIAEQISRPTGEVVSRIRSVTIYRLPDGRLCRFGLDQTGENGLFSICYTPDYEQVEITLWAHRSQELFSLRDWEYMQTGVAFHNRLLTLGGGVLHSSSLAWRGRGVAFSADSGTGKSTHVGLWKQYLGDSVEIINDDKPAIRFTGEGALLCGTPWSGKTALNCNRQVPLQAVVFIERGEVNSLRPLAAADSYTRLITQLSRPYYDADLGVKSLDFAVRLIETVPIYVLTCDMSRQAVETSFGGLFPGEEFV